MSATHELGWTLIVSGAVYLVLWGVLTPLISVVTHIGLYTTMKRVAVLLMLPFAIWLGLIMLLFANVVGK